MYKLICKHDFMDIKLLCCMYLLNFFKSVNRKKRLKFIY